MICLINKKLKRTVFIQNRDCVLQYTLFKSLGSVKKRLYSVRMCKMDTIQLIVKSYIVRKIFIFVINALIFKLFINQRKK